MDSSPVFRQAKNLCDIYYADRMIYRSQNGLLTSVLHSKNTVEHVETHTLITEPKYNCIYNLLLYIMYTLIKMYGKNGLVFVLLCDN